MTVTPLSELAKQASCQDDYDPNSMPVDKARQYIRQYLEPVTESTLIPLQQSLGRVLAEDIISPVDVPNHDNSAMDGYAFNADDIASGETRLQVIGTAFAGKPYHGRIEKGQCVRIMTGAVMPQGTDTVVVQERVEADGDSIRFTDAPRRTMNVRYAGEDLRQGQVVLAKGRRINSADLGLIASLGIGEVSIRRKLRVVFFSTGDELVGIGQPLQEGQLYDSNRYTLFGMLTKLGVEVIDLGAIKDDPTALEAVLKKAASDADVVITSGGVSVGEADYMKQLLADMGQVLFWKIAMKPGRPLAYGKIGTAHYFGLPGNPVAVMVTFYQFVRDALLVLMGQSEPPALPMLNAVCVEDIRKLKGRTEFQRGILFPAENGEWQVRTTGKQGSGILSSMSAANCFIVLDADTGDLPAGSQVKVQLLEGLA